MKHCVTDGDLAIKGAETREEVRLANDLMAKVHSQDYFDSMHWLETSGANYPGFRREHTRIALWKNELAGALRLCTDTIRLGESRLRTGSFSAVTTVPRHRNKGVCRALMEDALRYMSEHNYHAAMLFGIPNFYHRFGFATTLFDYVIAIEVEEAAATLRGMHRVREAKPGDISVIQKMHAANDADVPCSLLRSSAHFTNQWAHRCKGLRVLTNDKGKVIAYYIATRDRDVLRVSEVGVGENAACEPVLGACAQLAQDEMVGRIHFLVPPPHPFARFLLNYRSNHEMRVVRDAGGMMALINLSETLESLIPEWEALLGRSTLRDARAEVTLVVEEICYRVRINRGAVDIAQFSGKNKCSLSSSDLTHLVTGYLYPEDILGKTRRLMTDESRELMAILFPKRTPFVWHFDRV